MATTSRSANTQWTESRVNTDNGQTPADGSGGQCDLGERSRERMADDLRPEDSPHLTTEEEAATKKFLENVNKWRSARELEEVSLIALTLSDWFLSWSLPGAPLCLTILMIILCSFPGPQLSSS